MGLDYSGLSSNKQTIYKTNRFAEKYVKKLLYIHSNVTQKQKKTCLILVYWKWSSSVKSEEQQRGTDRGTDGQFSRGQEGGWGTFISLSISVLVAV